MPPVNDNFANAIQLTGQVGSVLGDNIGATAEAGEQPNSGFTVWYKWTMPNPVSPFLFFSTTQADTTILPQPYLRTDIRVYIEGNTVGTLNESAYVLAQKSNYGGVGPGSYVIIWLGQQFISSTLYIRIDGIAGQPQGHFELQWGASDYVPVLGSCGTCSKDLGYKVECIDSFSGPADLNSGDCRILGNRTTITSVNRKSGTYPSGTYMLRYCTGYYHNPGVDPIFFQPTDTLWVYQNDKNNGGAAWLFHSGVMDGATPSRVTDTGIASPAFPRAGDFNPYTVYSTGTILNGDLKVDYVDNAGTFHSGAWFYHVVQSTGVGGDLVPQGGPEPNANPVTLEIGQAYNPMSGFLAHTNEFDPRWPDAWRDQPSLHRSILCDSHIFHHAGGNMTWIYAMTRGGTGPRDFIGGDISQLVQSTTPNYAVGPAGPPTWALMRVLPDFSLKAALNSLNFGAGPNNAMTVVLHNNYVVAWGGVTLTPTGFFATQDPSYFPHPPLVIAIAASGDTAMTWLYNMTNPVGTLQLNFANADNDPFPTFVINITPLPIATIFDVANGVTSPVVGAGLCTRVDFNQANIGNGVPLACNMHISATNLDGSICQIAPAAVGAHFVNSIDKPFSINPGDNFPNSLQIYILQTGVPKQVRISFDYTDSGNTFPSSVLTVDVP